MNRSTLSRFVFLAALAAACSAQDAVTAVKGTVTKVDAAGKMVVVKTADGTEHTVRMVDRTAVHGGETSLKDATKQTYYGLRKGSKVVLHYTKRGADETAEEIDGIGKGGLKTADGTISKVDRDGKTITIKTAKGAEQTYRLADRATVDAGKDIGEGAAKTGKVTVYYTEEGGRKVAHFFEKTF
jgi:arginine repressor